MAALQSINTVCTGQILSGLPYDGSAEISYIEFKESVKTRLDHCLDCRVVNVIAFGIGTQMKSVEILKETFGFKEVHNSHNYKYPADSKRLILLCKDMNDYTPADIAPKKVVNSFAAPEAPARPVWDARTRDGTFERQFSTDPHIDQGFIRRLIARYSTIYRNGFFSNNGDVATDPFPMNRWVEIPANVEVPLFEKMFSWTILYERIASGEVRLWTGPNTPGGITPTIQRYRRAGYRIVAIKRIEDYRP